MRLIDFGFTYQDLIQMPLDEFIEYLQLLSKIRQQEKDFIEEQKILNGTKSKSDGKPIGAVIPRKS